MSDTAADPYRRWGYLQAELDPLGRLLPIRHSELDAVPAAAAEPWRRVYCGPIGAEFMHIPDAEVARSVAAQMESRPEQPDRDLILRRLAEAELLERFIHRRWVGSKRYSLEGSAALIPLLDAVLDTAAHEGAETALLGMGHRGRINVLVNVLGRRPRDLFVHFEDVDPRSVLGGGDVRYHLGATGDYTTATGRTLHLHLVSNPSHLEAVDPVLMGRARARQDRLSPNRRRRVVPICMHGDAAFAGQGIAAEILNMDGLPGFGVGGTIHIVVNNLIGFTTPPRLLHGSRHATDVARRLPVPILHVNGLDPEAVVRVGRMAARHRARFATDVVVDLIGFRRHGHSEVDDPTVTQPVLYKKIEAMPLLWEDYARRRRIGDRQCREIEAAILARLKAEREQADEARAVPSLRTLPDYWQAYKGGPYRQEYEVKTAVAQDRLREIAHAITAVEPSFHLHPRVQKGLEQRLAMSEGRRDVDWGMAEAFAFGTLLREGVPVRLSGEDSRRGTFNHRHAVLFDTETAAEYVPLANLHPTQAQFSVHDTVLSEAAVLGFEFGYSRDRPEALVCWEAQFGDFVNGGQVILDQFVSAAEDKWDLLSGLVLLLPHGYEGQGPEHSSARPERFLQQCAEDNLQVCQPSTAAQYFHLLRRQALCSWRKPLVVFTPKGLLRAGAAASSMEEFSSGGFRPVLVDPGLEEAERVLICSGKIAHELRAHRQAEKLENVAVVTLEQLYPFPERALREALTAGRGPAAAWVWVQEEPGNMGAEQYLRRRLETLLAPRHLITVHRSPSASPATGSSKAHKLEQQRLLRLAFGVPG